jgi:hypothetical protein
MAARGPQELDMNEAARPVDERDPLTHRYIQLRRPEGRRIDLDLRLRLRREWQQREGDGERSADEGDTTGQD